MVKNENPAIREAAGAFCQTLLDSILPAIREVARSKGYAVAVHGSLKRDIDLIAVAWTDQAVSADELLAAVRYAVGDILGNCVQVGNGSEKPHGRRAFTLAHPGIIGLIDLSIIPPTRKC